MNLSLQDAIAAATLQIRSRCPDATVEYRRVPDPDSSRMLSNLYVYCTEVSEELSTWLDEVDANYWRYFTIIQLPRRR